MQFKTKRILLVENDLDVLRSVARRLQLAGYTVIQAESVAAAEKAIVNEIFHLAIIDIRVSDDRSDTDTSGFAIARSLPATIPCIFHTAHDTKEHIREALGSIGAEDIIAKEDPEAPRKLVTRVNELFTQSIGINFDLSLHGDFNLNELNTRVETLEKASKVKITEEDLGIVVQKLFPEALAVNLLPLLGPEKIATHSTSGAILLRVEEQRNEGSPVPVVLKVAECHDVVAEAERYHIIQPYLGGQLLAQLHGAAYSRNLGGLIYSLIGAQNWDSIQPLANILSSCTIDAGEALLKRFIRQTFGKIYEEAQPSQLDLAQEYTTQLHLTIEKLSAALHDIHQAKMGNSILQFDELDESLVNPVYWAIQNGKFRSFGQISTFTCLCHGDLHSHNILVDDEHHCWLIDFARAGRSHVLRDLAELETDIKLRFIATTDLAQLLQFERNLVAPLLWHEPIALQHSLAEFERCFRYINTIRQLALELVGDKSTLLEYYQTMFWYMLNAVRLRNLTMAQKVQMLLSAAVIAEKLQPLIT